MSTSRPRYIPTDPSEDHAVDLDEPKEDVIPESTGTEEFEVHDAELPSKAGNYLFTIGNVGCGKSTLQTALVYRLWTREDIRFDFNHEKNDQRHDALLHQWILRLKSGQLPARTKQGRLQEFNIAFGQDRKKTLELNFLEISGEDVKSIVPTLDTNRPPAINRQLVDYLKADRGRINKRFLFVSDATAHLPGAVRDGGEDFTEDMLFSAFIRYLLSKEGLGLDRINTLFVAAKWDAAQFHFGTAKNYFRRTFPNTRGMLRSDRCRVQYIPFSIGSVGEKKVGNKVEPRVVSLESRYLDLAIQWIYHSFTGIQLKNMPKVQPSLLDKIRYFFSPR